MLEDKQCTAKWQFKVMFVQPTLMVAAQYKPQHSNFCGNLSKFTCSSIIYWWSSLANYWNLSIQVNVIAVCCN